MSKRNSKPQSNAERLEQLRTRVMIEKEGVGSISSSEFPYHSSNRHQDIDYIKEFIKRFRVKIIRKEQYDMEFDLIGVDTAIANALRRIMIAEVPTIAIEKVYIYNNTSIVQDEVLAHRLDMNTIVFKIEHECTFNPKAREGETDPQKLYIGHNLLSDSLIWIPKGDQEEQYASCPIRPVHNDILIAQMRPGQKIKLEAHCEKGIGKDHAKWSPVATASYRLMPEIILKNEITGDLADKFAACFTKGVVEVENRDVGDQFVKYAKVVNPRIDMVSREALRHKEFEDIVQLTRIRDHFIFNVESTGIMDSEKIFIDSVHILQAKCKRLLTALEHKLREQERDHDQMDIY
ncbi:18721_t:CDS:10 [Dentiscutata erythropus]|uniref:18721_t:CDS:1 n=1 Tax=Dentiscutata erythropus TaxID=1348616 RepID=A0A9N9J0C0_9GLOM|nr:18721_t:CDS:10 [Dentiscutata erythropus]